MSFNDVSDSLCDSLWRFSFSPFSVQICIAWQNLKHRINVTFYSFLLFFPVFWTFSPTFLRSFDVQPHNLMTPTHFRKKTTRTVSPVVEPFAFSTDVVAGRRAGVACIVSAGDLPITIEWLKDGRPLEPGLAATISTSDFTSFLSFPRLSRAHTGNYTCRAENPAAASEFTAPMRVQGLFPTFEFFPIFMIFTTLHLHFYNFTTTFFLPSGNFFSKWLEKRKKNHHLKNK